MVLKSIIAPFVAIWRALRWAQNESGSCPEVVVLLAMPIMILTLMLSGGCTTGRSPVESVIQALHPTVSLKCQVVVEAGGVPIVGMTGSCVAGIDDQSCWTEQTGVLIRAPVMTPSGVVKEGEAVEVETAK